MYHSASILNATWEVKDFDERTSLMISQIYDIPLLIAKLIDIRKIPQKNIEQFLNPDLLNYLPNPFELKDMQKSVEKVSEVISKKGTIGIVADYDVDGSTSSAILYKFFENINQHAIIKIPDRLKDGYGPNEKILNFFLNRNIDLLITLDCGTSCIELFNNKKYSIFDTIIIDHHISEKNLPKVFSIINPNRYDETNSFKDLAAVGITYLFIMALRKTLREKDFFNKNNIIEPNLMNSLDLVALGTICDVVSLKNYNRIFVKKGVEIIKKRENKAIAAILDNSNIYRPPSISDLGYIVGPQLNAASRIDDSSLSSKLLISNDNIEIESISRKLVLLNEKRKLIEKNILDQAYIQAANNKNKYISIVKGENWHLGVLGIVASRLVEKFNKPAIVISFVNDYGVGSARSLKSINLGNLIMQAKSKNLLIEGGGHEMAAGLKILSDKFFEFEKFIENELFKYDPLVFEKITYYDSILELEEINKELINNLEILEPYGNGNPKPKFIVKNAKIEFSKIIKERHVIVNIKNDKNELIKGICFNCTDNILGEYLLKGKRYELDLGCSIERNTYQSSSGPQLIIHDAMIIN